jgi:hypothetical protein
MLALLLIIGMAPQAAPATARPATPPSVQTAPLSGTALPKPEDVDPNALLKVKRIFVESFGDDIISKEIQSMIVSSLVATKRF